jgi:hypothetical protein
MSSPVDLLARLNPYSARFARVLFDAYPECQARAAMEPWPNADPGCFVVEVPSPADPAQVLSAGTDGGEVTVGFGEHDWHAHFGAWTGDDESTSFAEALAEVAGILAGRRVLAVCFRDGRGSVSDLVDARQVPDLGDCERVVLYGWHGPAARAA